MTVPQSPSDKNPPSPLQGGEEDPSPAPRRPQSQSWLHRMATRFGFANGESLKDKLERALNSEDESGKFFSPQERNLLLKSLAFSKLRVDDVMVPRADINAIEENESLDALLKLFAKAGHSRAPVYRETLDEPLGMIHIKDLMKWITDQAGTSPGDVSPGDACLLDLRCVDLSRTVGSLGLIRDILYAPPSMPVISLLHRMQTTRIHLALVFDEYGGIDGLVSIEDLIEEVFGDIEDEHDVDEPPLIFDDGSGGLIADGRATLEDLKAKLGVDLALPEIEDESESINGLILTMLGRLPAPGERLSHPAGVEFEALDVHQSRVAKVRIRRARTGATRGSGAAEASRPAA
jgi:CBS domain containing-hemolysin-like protein